MGLYLRSFRPGKVLETSVLGFVLVLLAIWGGQWVSQSRTLQVFHVECVHACSPDHPVRICGFGGAGLVVAGAPRLPEHVRETWDDCAAGGGHCGTPPYAAYAGAHALH